MLNFEKSIGQLSGDAELTAGYMCLAFSAVFQPIDLAMLSQRLSIGREEKSSRTPGLRGQGNEEKMQRRL